VSKTSWRKPSLLREDQPEGMGFVCRREGIAVDAIRPFAGDSVTNAVVESEAAGHGRKVRSNRSSNTRSSREDDVMAAYLVADLDITNSDEFQKYVEKVVATVKQYGGRYLIRGGDVQVLEGASKTKRLTILEFPSAEQLKKWYDSPEYQAIIGF
jgi:uncharacterized protein (DUF1330 family)